MQMPAQYTVLDQNEMTYTTGGADIATVLSTMAIGAGVVGAALNVRWYYNYVNTHQNPTFAGMLQTVGEQFVSLPLDLVALMCVIEACTVHTLIVRPIVALLDR